MIRKKKEGELKKMGEWGGSKRQIFYRGAANTTSLWKRTEGKRQGQKKG